MNLRQINLVNLKQAVSWTEHQILENPIFKFRNLVIFNLALMLLSTLGSWLPEIFSFLKFFSIAKITFDIASTLFVLNFFYQYLKNENYKPSIEVLVYSLTALNVLILVGMLWINFIVFVVGLFQ